MAKAQIEAAKARGRLKPDVKQIFLNTEARLNSGVIVAKAALNPLVIGAGIGYRFWGVRCAAVLAGQRACRASS